MELHSDYYLSQPAEQLKAQQLARNIFFGPFNVLARHSFLEENDIRFFICVGIPTQRLASLTNSSVDTLIINFDEETHQSASDAVAAYQSHNSALLRQLIDNLLTITPSNPEIEGSRSLTPQPEPTNISESLMEDLQKIYQNGNVFCGASGVEKFRIFNNLLNAFQMVNANAGIFIFSQNGNDEELASLLMSHILLKHPFIKLNEAFRFVKSLRPTISDIKDERLFWVNGLVEFYESLRRSCSNENDSPRAQKFRKRIDSMDESNYMDNTSRDTGTRIIAQAKRTRLD